ncbi:hypothetical protein V8C86DRAFT_2712920, partial [Haematococcus lacustris]
MRCTAPTATSTWQARSRASRSRAMSAAGGLAGREVRKERDRPEGQGGPGWAWWWGPGPGPPSGLGGTGRVLAAACPGRAGALKGWGGGSRCVRAAVAGGIAQAAGLVGAGSSGGVAGSSRATAALSAGAAAVYRATVALQAWVQRRACSSVGRWPPSLATSSRSSRLRRREGARVLARDLQPWTSRSWSLTCGARGACAPVPL